MKLRTLSNTGIFLLSLLSVGFTLLKSAAQQPNILLIMSDDHSPRGVSVYVSYRNTTPNMDRLAHEGLRLTQCMAVNSICGPSRAAILTGKYGHKNGFRRNLLRFDGSQTTFPKLLQKAGYQTALVGKWHLSLNDAKSPPTGFDYWNILPGQGDYYDPDMFEMGERKSHKGYATTIFTEMGLEFLKKRDPDKPLYYFIPCPIEPHSRLVRYSA